MWYNFITAMIVKTMGIIGSSNPTINTQCPITRGLPEEQLGSSVSVVSIKW